MRSVSGLGARGKTALLSSALATGAVALTVLSIAHQGGGLHLSDPVLFAAVTVTFFLAEQYLVNIEFRRQSHSLTFAGVPLVVGILALPVQELVLARLVSTLAALLLQRISAEKIFYNTAGYTFEAALSATVVHVWVPIDATIGLREVGIVLVCVAVGDQLMSLSVLWVIGLHNGRVSRPEVLEVLGRSVVLSASTTLFAVALSMLIERGVVGDVIVVLLMALGMLIYRAYAATTRRHESLQRVHDFVAQGGGSQSLDELGYQSLEQIRHLLRAAHAELVLPGEETAPEHNPAPAPMLRLTIAEDNQRGAATWALQPDDWVRVRALRSGEPTLAPHGGKDAALNGWLEAQGIADAMVAPLLVHGTALGLVAVTDRLGDIATFTADDLILLQTLTGHLAVAIASTRLVERLSYEATHDSLTGLFNRAHLTAALAIASAEHARDSAVLLLDLDKFKEVNDVLGHDIGDRLLIVMAERLRNCLPPSAIVARLGGDEFAILLHGLGPDAAAAATAFAVHACQVLRRPVRFDEVLLAQEASIGIAMSEGESGVNLLRCADTAMYVAKANHEDVVVYHPDMDQGRAERLALVADLRMALDNHLDQFPVLYQAKIDLATGVAVSAEALVRWNHPAFGLIHPDRFIPLAETSGLIDRLTTHVLSQSLAQCAAWRQAGFDVSVAVNFSARNLTDVSLPTRVADMLAAASVPAHRLILEITESSAMEEAGQVLPILTRLADLGISISLDDFGTGYSSLSYLQQLPVRELKIDRSFVSGLTGETAANARALISSIAALGAALGLRIVAEGIETREQLKLVAELGCHIGQGYLIAYPLDSATILAWLVTQQSRPARLIPA